MKTWAAVVLGIVAVVVVSAALASGGDNTGETVRASEWADDVCGAVGAWEGQLEAIGDEISLSRVGVRRHDGGSGDEVEGTLFVRGAVDRAIQATEDTLQEGLRRAGQPDTADGREASLALQTWAQRAEDLLLVAQRTFDDGPNTTVRAFANLGVAVAALERIAVEGRAAFARVAASSDDLANEFEGSRACRELMRDEP